MSIILKNNLATVRSLGLLTRSSEAAQKELQKAATGMKIDDAQDDVSAYAVSEKMRMNIRALDQSYQNVQNASSLLNVWRGGLILSLMSYALSRSLR